MLNSKERIALLIGSLQITAIEQDAALAALQAQMAEREAKIAELEKAAAENDQKQQQ